MEQWPTDNQPADFEALVKPFIDLYLTIYCYPSRERFRYEGYLPGHDTMAHALHPNFRLTREYLNEKDLLPMQVLIETAVQVGIEQGRRLALSSGLIESSDVLGTMNRYMQTNDRLPDELMGLLRRASKRLFGEDSAPDPIAALSRYLESMDIDVPEEQLLRLVERQKIAPYVASAASNPFPPASLKTPTPAPPVEEKSLSWEAHQAIRRPGNYNELSNQRQWDIDKELGILDWDGT